MRLGAHPVTHENVDWAWERRRPAGFPAQVVPLFHTGVAAGTAALPDYFRSSTAQHNRIFWLQKLERRPSGNLKDRQEFPNTWACEMKQPPIADV
jgi:hypothetical protein